MDVVLSNIALPPLAIKIKWKIWIYHSFFFWLQDANQHSSYDIPGESDDDHEELSTAGNLACNACCMCLSSFISFYFDIMEKFYFFMSIFSLGIVCICRSCML